MGKYYQPEIETASREEILRIQNEKIVKQVKHVYENVPYYRDLMDKKGVKPEDIKSVDDIKKLPFLSKSDLREAYPYGLLATDLKNCVGVHRQSHRRRRRHRGRCVPGLLRLRPVYGRRGTSRRLTQSRLSDTSHVVGQHRAPDPVHDGLRLHYPLLHTLIRCVHR